ncbi:hypothetical protein [Nonomuraea sp. SBT364]|nr:hypothetical protein [Nonomuraea sp. SBT364]
MKETIRFDPETDEFEIEYEAETPEEQQELAELLRQMFPGCRGEGA